ncbi:MAG: hypothetical protein J6X42_04050, partial [Alphaproteobacteria bacterium]|nr:hypothetical protein [Alphaproteobacteria bacterium]
ALYQAELTPENRIFLIIICCFGRNLPTASFLARCFILSNFASVTRLLISLRSLNASLLNNQTSPLAVKTTF